VEQQQQQPYYYELRATAVAVVAVASPTVEFTTRSSTTMIRVLFCFAERRGIEAAGDKTSPFARS
jgi:hypothetical protein